MQRKAWIGGRWADASSGQTREIINPVDGSVLARVPEMSADDVKQAIAAARRAFDEGPWPRLPARERGTMLFKIAEAIRARAAAFAEADTRNMGKPIHEAEFDVADAVPCLECYGGLAAQNHGELLEVAETGVCD